jgi:single-strand DNA-binding protein
MNNLRNQVQLIGHLGANPEVAVTSNGNKCAKLSLATSEKYKNQKGELVTTTTWHRITLWEKQAELAEQYLSKGKEVCISGKLVNNEYVDKEGVKRSNYEVRVSDILLLGSNKASASTPAQAAVAVEDNLPF